MEALLKKIRITCSVVNKIRKHPSRRILLLLYNSMIKSHLQYCIMTWCNGNKTKIKHLNTAVNKFIKILFGLNARDSVKDVMQKHTIFSINQLKELEMASFMYKYLHGDLPETFKNLFDDNYLDGSNSCQTRSQSKLFPRFCRIELTKQSLKYRGPLTWNFIPITITIRKIKSYNSFKKEIKNKVAYHPLKLRFPVVPLV